MKDGILADLRTGIAHDLQRDAKKRRLVAWARRNRANLEAFLTLLDGYARVIEAALSSVAPAQAPRQRRTGSK
jgi:hypothetical protein